mmetsp:Transcript_45353/g.145947  ORF Transcript_45353/g.145947 Transcript_45353/m.145947 type:complete len:575 (+) Transcript_45353:880-2604(+)
MRFWLRHPPRPDRPRRCVGCRHHDQARGVRRRLLPLRDGAGAGVGEAKVGGARRLSARGRTVRAHLSGLRRRRHRVRRLGAGGHRLGRRPRALLLGLRDPAAVGEGGARHPLRPRLLRHLALPGHRRRPPPRRHAASRWLIRRSPRRRPSRRRYQERLGPRNHLRHRAAAAPARFSARRVGARPDRLPRNHAADGALDVSLHTSAGPVRHPRRVPRRRAAGRVEVPLPDRGGHRPLPRPPARPLLRDHRLLHRPAPRPRLRAHCRRARARLAPLQDGDRRRYLHRQPDEARRRASLGPAALAGRRVRIRHLWPGADAWHPPCWAGQAHADGGRALDVPHAFPQRSGRVPLDAAREGARRARAAARLRRHRQGGVCARVRLRARRAGSLRAAHRKARALQGLRHGPVPRRRGARAWPARLLRRRVPAGRASLLHVGRGSADVGRRDAGRRALMHQGGASAPPPVPHRYRHAHLCASRQRAAPPQAGRLLGHGPRDGARGVGADARRRAARVARDSQAGGPLADRRHARVHVHRPHGRVRAAASSDRWRRWRLRHSRLVCRAQAARQEEGRQGEAA